MHASVNVCVGARLCVCVCVYVCVCVSVCLCVWGMNMDHAALSSLSYFKSSNKFE